MVMGIILLTRFIDVQPFPPYETYGDHFSQTHVNFSIAQGHVRLVGQY